MWMRAFEDLHMPVFRDGVTATHFDIPTSCSTLSHGMCAFESLGISACCDDVIATHGSTLQHTACVHLKNGACLYVVITPLQHTAAHCNTLQHTLHHAFEEC